MTRILLILAVLCAYPAVYANAQKDTAQVRTIKLDEVEISASPKENLSLMKAPIASSQLSASLIESYHLNSLKEVSSMIPNFFMPDYGSKLTSALYIRGIGSRLSIPSVALYVDNVPYLDKSSFDFDFYDINKIEVLRGPQGTLYGRNTLGGVVHVHTRSPLQSEGTKISFGSGTNGKLKGTLSRHHQFTDKLAFSVSGYVDHHDGYFTNTYTGERADNSFSTGGRTRLVWLVAPRWRMELTGQYDYVNQGAYPYGLFVDSTQKVNPIAYNDKSGYWRRMANASYSLIHNADNFRFTSTTSYQHLNDKMQMDQDYTPKSIYTLEQTQKQKAFTQEFVFRSNNNKNYQWVTGASGFYQSNKNNSPVTFKKDGMQEMFQSMFDELFQSGAMPVKLTVLDSIMPISGFYDMPTYSAALFHQSTFRNLLTPGLSLTLGMRMEYEKISLRHNTATTMNVRAQMPVPGFPPMEMPLNADIEGKENVDYLQFLPKAALMYEINDQHAIYGSVARGYKAGGFNMQMFSDIIRYKLKNAMPGSKPVDLPISDIISYDPEYNWSYEIGAKTNPVKDKLFIDGALFYIASRDQQIVQFAPTGFGRMAKNAGRGRSVGVELSARAELCKNLWVYGSYGFTSAKFTQYTDTVNINGTNQEVNYKGKYVPMVPKHNMSVGINYTRALRSVVLDRISGNFQLKGNGEIYWTEENLRKQPFYTTCDAKVSLHKSIVRLDLWAKNIFNTKYQTFYFESMGSPFAQLGKPFEFGADIVVQF
ncbi:MAG: TonB-dependent receptor [Bacteroidales bacterium]